MDEDGGWKGCQSSHVDYQLASSGLGSHCDWVCLAVKMDSWNSKQKTPMQCLHQDMEAVVVVEGEHTCTQCGTILGNVINEGAEWRMNGDDEPTRTGGFISDLLPESSYGAMMSRRRGPQNENQKILSKMSAWCMANHGERSWMGIFDMINTTGAQASLPKAIL